MLLSRYLRWLWPAAIGLSLLSGANPALNAPSPAPATGLQQNLTFEQYSPHAANSELIERMVSPVAAERTRATLAASGKTLAERPIDLSGERFTVYAPARAPATGYGLLVFVPPWNDARLPPQWAPVLDRFGIIFVTAARSGNDADIIGRRAPLALLAAQNVVARYPVDANRIYVSGFSGGSRVATRLAVAYPDLFTGAVLDAGSDPIGGDGAPSPDRTLLARLQERSLLVAVTGTADSANVAKDAETAQSMNRWCVFNFTQRMAPWLDHDIAGPDALAQALTLLDSRAPTNSARLTACRARLESQLTAGVQRVQADIAAHRLGDARRLIDALDARFGGYAEDRLVKLSPAPPN